MSADLTSLDGYRRLARQYDPSGTIYEEGFLTPAECQVLIACFERNNEKLRSTTDSSRFFDNRFLWFTSLPWEEREAKAIMQSARFGIMSRIKRFFPDVPHIYSDTIQLVKWSRGQPMPAHADNAFPDGKDHPTAFRDFAGVIYLNNDFLGGELYYEPQKLIVVPKPGLLVVFPGGMSHMHGVRAIESGTRYTSPSWYSRDPSRKDRSQDEDYGSIIPR